VFFKVIRELIISGVFMPLPSTFIFSQSNLQDYVDCPRRFYLKHLLHLAWPSIESEPVQENELFRLRGERFHKMVHQLLIGIPVDRISSQNTDVTLASWWKSFLSSHQDLLTAQTSQLYPEYTLSTRLAGYRLLAKYDLLLAHEDGTWIIYDWKTYRTRPRRERLSARLQTRLYPFILSSPPNPSSSAPENLKLDYWYANFPAQPEVFSYSPAQYEQDSQSLTQLIKSIEAAAKEDSENAHPKTLQLDRCLFCVYRSLCNRGIRAGEGAEAEEVDLLSSLEDFDFEQINEVEF
jgi:CRISPR/Cas system-associated exonuclease Cas4 (RecB family)